jgi:hypothetical protein
MDSPLDLVDGGDDLFNDGCASALPPTGITQYRP